MTSNAELGDFLRSRRARLRPESVGLDDGRRRRTQGLRREEVAERTGISTDWYVPLEQGRDVNAIERHQNVALEEREKDSDDAPMKTTRP